MSIYQPYEDAHFNEEGSKSPTDFASIRGLFRLDPADQVLPADPFQQGRMVGSEVPPDHPDHLVIVIATGHEPAFASDQLHLAPPTLAVFPA